MHTKQDFKTWDRSHIKKIHLQFCKRYLEVNYAASKLACRAELGRLPLIIPVSIGNSMICSDIWHKYHE